MNSEIKNFHITHDDFFKLTFAIPELAIPFLKNVLPEETIEQLDLVKLEVQNGLLGETDFFQRSAADLIYIVPYKNGMEKLRVFVILEHKSYSDPLTIFQLTRYCGHIMEKEVESAKEKKAKMSKFRFPPIIPIIIHHGRTPFRAVTELTKLYQPLVRAEQYMLNLKAILFDLNRITVDNLPQISNSPALLSVLKMMQSIFNRDIAIKASEALKLLRPYSKDPKYQYLVRTMVIYMARCSQHLTKTEYVSILHNDNIIDQGEKNMLSVAEQLIAEGREEGRVEGREEGREEGRVEERDLMIKSMRKTLIRSLTAKFGSLPKQIEKKINAKNDIVVLESLFESAVIANSIKEFAQEL